MRWGKRGILYLSLHCHHQNDSPALRGYTSLLSRQNERMCVRERGWGVTALLGFMLFCVCNL